MQDNTDIVIIIKPQFIVAGLNGEIGYFQVKKLSLTLAIFMNFTSHHLVISAKSESTQMTQSHFLIPFTAKNEMTHNI